MVKKVMQKTHILYAIIILSLITFASVLVSLPTNAACDASNTNCSEQNVNFEVTVNETLSVSLTDITSDSTNIGDTGDLLTNKLSLTVTSNNASGFLASMTTADTGTALTWADSNTVESESTIPTLTAAKYASKFPEGYWGFSLVSSADDACVDADANNPSVIYQALQPLGGTASNILSRSTPAANASQTICFGAKASVNQDAGTYEKTVVISVVSGTNATIVTPTPVDDPEPANNPSSNPTTPSRSVASAPRSHSTTSTTTPTDTTTITEVYNGTTTKNSYAAPQGVTTTEISEGTPLATGLAVTAAVAAASGIVFFIIAKRRKDEDEEEEEY